MFHYVRGLLVLNEPGARAPGSSSLVDRWLVIRTPGGTIMRAFDYTHLPPEGALLSEREGIQEGNTYTFILTVLAYTLAKSDNATHALDDGADIWRGTVIDSQWVLSDEGYLTVDPQEIGTYNGVLLETAIGQVIIPRSRFEIDEHCERLPRPLTCQQGDVFYWDQIRLSLLAILA